MKKYKTLSIVFLIHSVYGSIESKENNDTPQTTILSPERLRAPARGYIANEYFLMIGAHPWHAEALVSMYQDERVYTCLRAGLPWSPLEVDEAFLDSAWSMEHEQDPVFYRWVVITHDKGICATITARKHDKVPPDTREIAYVVHPKAQNRGLAKCTLNAVCASLSPNTPFYATSNSDNIFSIKVLTSCQFSYQGTLPFPQYNREKNVYTRLSNAVFEESTLIHFTYSGQVVSLGELMG